MVRLVIIGHPVERMRERGISEQDISRALNDFVTKIDGKGDSITSIGPSVSGSLINEAKEVIVKSVA